MKAFLKIAKQILVIILMVSPVYFSGQTWIYFTGIITEEGTGMAIPEHPVFISEGDSIPITFTLTNLDGVFFDSVFIDTISFAGSIMVSTPECNNFMQTKIFENFNSINVADFEICVLNFECEAAFYAEVDFTNPFLFYFTDVSFGSMDSWYWEFGDGATSSQQNPSHLYNSEGQFEVCLTITDSLTNCISTFCDFVFVDETNCISDFAWHQPKEDELTIVFEDLSSGEINFWLWDFGDGQEWSTEQSPTHVYAEPGQYNVTLTIGDTTGFCFSVSEQLVLVNENIECVAGFVTTLDTLSNTPNVYHFTNTSIGNFTDLFWDFGDGTYSEEISPTHTYLDGGSYQVCLFISGDDSLSCFDTFCESITTPAYYNFGGHAFLGDYPLNVGENDSSNIALASLYRRINNKWEFMDSREFWKFGYYWFADKPEGEYIIRIDLLPRSAAYGSFSPTYLPNIRFWENANTFTLQNNEEFAVDVYFSEMSELGQGIGSISGFILKTPDCIQEVAIDGQLVYLLNSENEIVAFTYTNQLGEFIFEGLAAGSYFVKAEVTGKSSYMVSVILDSENIEQSGLVLGIGCESFVGIEENFAIAEFTIDNIYPQPSSSLINIEISGNLDAGLEYTLNNLYGNTVLSGTISKQGSSTRMRMNVSNLPSGLYFLNVSSKANSIRVVKKILIN